MVVQHYQAPLDEKNYSRRMVDEKIFANAMVNEKILANALALEKEFEWFVKILEARLKIHFQNEPVENNLLGISPPDISNDKSSFSDFVKYYNLSNEERIILILALIPLLKPNLLDVFLVNNKSTGKIFTEFGGSSSQSVNGFIPTAETAFFIIAGEDVEKRIQLQSVFEHSHFFYKHNVLSLEAQSNDEPRFRGVIKLSKEYFDFFTSGYFKKPDFSSDFPAKLITTNQSWSDLFLERYTLEQIHEIKAWIKYKNVLFEDWEMSKKLNPGYRTLFYGPPGTGKTMTASLIGKETGRDVYRIDLSTVISKYIGETEKNLEKVFSQAEHKDWILFFDEADALFGKRTSISDAHDKFANQEISYLLQRVEDFDGVVILASNFKSNFDDAFTRRFQSIIHFPLPKPSERLKIWKNAFSHKSIFHEALNFDFVAEKYEMSGGSIMNVVRYASLKAIERGDSIIYRDYVNEGIKREFQKEGKTF